MHLNSISAEAVARKIQTIQLPRGSLFAHVVKQNPRVIEDASARLRAYAYATDRSLSEVARDVVARRLRFDRDPRVGSEDGGRGTGGVQG